MIVTSLEDLIISGEINAAHGWSGDFFALFYELEDQYEDVYSSFVYLIPEEGGVRWSDAMVIPSNASSVCTAHTFLKLYDGCRKRQHKMLSGMLMLLQT